MKASFELHRNEIKEERLRFVKWWEGKKMHFTVHTWLSMNPVHVHVPLNLYTLFLFSLSLFLPQSVAAACFSLLWPGQNLVVCRWANEISTMITQNFHQIDLILISKHIHLIYPWLNISQHVDFFYHLNFLFSLHFVGIWYDVIHFVLPRLLFNLHYSTFICRVAYHHGELRTNTRPPPFTHIKWSVNFLHNNGFNHVYFVAAFSIHNCHFWMFAHVTCDEHFLALSLQLCILFFFLFFFCCWGSSWQYAHGTLVLAHLTL